MSDRKVTNRKFKTDSKARTDMIRIEMTDVRMKQLQEIKELTEDKGMPLYLWGNGAYTKTLSAYLKDHGVGKKAISVVDDEYYGDQMRSDTIPLSRYLGEDTENTVMIFGFYDYSVIKEKRKKYGRKIPHLYEFHMTVVYGDYLRWEPEFVKERLGEFQHTYEMLDDEKSRKTLQCYLNAAVAGEFDRLYESCHEDRAYFNDLVRDCGITVLLDCGAYDGDSIHDFISLFPDYEKIMAFEPDLSNVRKILEREKREKIRDLLVLQKGVWDETTELFFEADGKSSSHFSDSGTVTVPVIRLDEIKDDTSDHVLIKMDIEGSELAALHGAEALIREKKPCLTICVYHREEDLITIPQYIESIAGNGVYSYHLRFHGPDLSELVFYAVPKKF